MKTLEGLNQPVLDLEGNPVEENGRVVTVGYIVGNALARAVSGEPVRAMDVALKVYHADGAVDLEDADYALVFQAVRDDRFLTNMGRAAALRVLGRAEKS